MKTEKIVTEYIEGNGAPALLTLCESAARGHVQRIAHDANKGKVTSDKRLGHLLFILERLAPKTNGSHCQGEDFLLTARGGVPIRPCIGGVRSEREIALLGVQADLAQAAWYFRNDAATVQACHQAISTIETLF